MDGAFVDCPRFLFLFPLCFLFLDAAEALLVELLVLFGDFCPAVFGVASSSGTVAIISMWPMRGYREMRVTLILH